MGREAGGWGARLVTWKDSGRDKPSHFTAIDNANSPVIERLAALRESTVDSDDATEEKRRKLARLSRSRGAITSHCAQDEYPLQAGKQTLFANASFALARRRRAPKRSRDSEAGALSMGIGQQSGCALDASVEDLKQGGTVGLVRAGTIGPKTWESTSRSGAITYVARAFADLVNRRGILVYTKGMLENTVTLAEEHDIHPQIEESCA
ncbi:hypothetical protein CLCR_07553 [Cladophialophora carrionii]|uniref:Uncharacterized protein n=1 Tax=Cladophialophora carrionii TaxID=86049 RepID=A0A1C1CM65_9EURO|nr:hypothetical protein CLCR_07553 [Cladophialophora carrionii]